MTYHLEVDDLQKSLSGLAHHGLAFVKDHAGTVHAVDLPRAMLVVRGPRLFLPVQVVATNGAFDTVYVGLPAMTTGREANLFVRPDQLFRPADKVRTLPKE